MKIGYVLLFACVLFITAGIIIYPQESINACLYGFTLWAKCVLPCLFPFMITSFFLTRNTFVHKLSQKFSKVNRLFNLPDCASVCFFMAITSGYPTGAKAVSDFYRAGMTDKNGAEKLAYLCTTSGPLFLVGTIGTVMFGSNVIGLRVFMCHLIANVVPALAFSMCKKGNSVAYMPKLLHSDNVLYECFHSSVTGVIVAGGFISFFYTVAQIADCMNLFYPLEMLLNNFVPESISKGICFGLIEATTGCKIISEINSKLSIALCGFLITFGGISIICQQIAYLNSAKISGLKFVGFKFLQSVLCFILLLF